jgi:hypothetical protein
VPFSRVAIACASSSEHHWGLGVLVRVDKTLHGVLMPVFDNPESVPIYFDFLKNKNETLHVNYCQFDMKDRCWKGASNSIPVTWPKITRAFCLIERHRCHDCAER